MRNICFLLCFGFSHFLAGQNYYTSFNGFVVEDCGPGSTGTWMHPQGWEMYQTTDGFWDGPRDSTRCISGTPIDQWGGMKIDLLEINPELPLFVRALGTELEQIQALVPNSLYNLHACFDMLPDNNLWINGSGCAQGICTGAFIGIAIPDSSGVPEAALRMQTGLVNQTGTFCGAGVETCFPSEYFTDQHIREIILKFSFSDSIDLSGKVLNVRNLFIEYSFLPPGLITEVKAQPWHFNNGAYTLNVRDVADAGWDQNFLMLYQETTYPDNNHQSFIEAAPEPNASVQEVINLEVDEYQSLEIQPFTNFRGALVAGSDSVRHIANLVNNGGDICVNFFDLIVSGGGEYRHGGGHISMQNPRSCMQFRTGSALRVMEGQTLYYGNEGAGMLVLCPSSTIALERNAGLVMDGLLQLNYCKEDQGDQQIYMDLLPGASLTFTKNARISNVYSQDQQTRLNVRMLGGVLDDGGISAADRALIHRIYPEASPVFQQNIQLYPNPCADYFTLTYTCNAGETVQLDWINVNGQSVLSETLAAQKGLNEWQPQLPDLAGMYLLSIAGTSGKTFRKVIRTAP